MFISHVHVCEIRKINSIQLIADYDRLIREYGSTLYVGMPRKKNGRPYISIAIDDLKSLVIYTDRF